MPTDAPSNELSVVHADESLASVVLTALGRDYDQRYGAEWGEPASTEIARYPMTEFAAPDGAFLVLTRGGEVVAGGAFRRFDDSTSEFKRIWTSAAHRRQGLARRILLELEDESRRRGYTTAYLTTGPRQSEARQLYPAAGYTPLFDATLSPEEVIIHGFAKSLTAQALDLDRIQRSHDAVVTEFIAELPDVAKEQWRGPRQVSETTDA